MKWEDIKTYSDAAIYRNEQDLYTSINGFDTEEEAERGILTVEEICKIKDISKIDLYKGDCLEVMDELIDKGVVVDAIICDLPYGLTSCAWDSVISFDEMWKRLNKLIKPNGAIVLFGSEPFSSALRMSNIKNYKYDWVWNKKQASNQLNAKRQPLKIHELVHIFAGGNTATYYPLMTKGKFRKKGGSKVKSEIVGDSIIGYHTFNDDYYPVSILDNFSNANRNNRLHPTQKPVALMEYLIKTYTNENETVLDFTMGSGTTGVACVNANRNFIGIELDKKYFTIAKDRITMTKYSEHFGIELNTKIEKTLF